MFGFLSSLGHFSRGKLVRIGAEIAPKSRRGNKGLPSHGGTDWNGEKGNS